LDKQTTAVLAVDCQNGFTMRCPNELGICGTDETWIEKVQNFLKRSHEWGFKIFASIDFHPINHSSFNIWPKHCVNGTYGCEIFFNESMITQLIKKGTRIDADSYSAFYDYIDAGEKGDFCKTVLDDKLIEHGIKNIIIIGLAGDYCVIQTIKDAIKFGYKVYYASEYIKSVDGRKISEILQEMELKEYTEEIIEE
jgi:nicotinamidase/pyrazinamidase